MRKYWRSIRQPSSTTTLLFLLVVLQLYKVQSIEQLKNDNNNINQIITPSSSSTSSVRDTALHHHPNNKLQHNNGFYDSHQSRSLTNTARTDTTDTRAYYKVESSNETTSCFDDGVDNTDALACWLRNLKVYIPDETFKKSIFSLTIKDLKCYNLTVQSIASSYQPSSSSSSSSPKTKTTTTKQSPEYPTLSVSLSGVSAVCEGKYHSGLTGGNVYIFLTSSSNDSTPTEDAFHLELQITSSMYQPHHSSSSTATPTTTPTANTSTTSIKIPTSANVTSCMAQLQVPKDNGIRFTGSISARILELFSKSIASKVTNAIKTIACPQLKLVLDPMLTDGIGVLDGLVEGLLDNYTSTDDSVVEGEDGVYSNPPFGGGGGDEIDGANGMDGDKNASLVNWEDDLVLLQKILVGGNAWLTDHIDRGVILEMIHRHGWLPVNDGCRDCGYFFRGVNGLVNFLTNGTEQVNFDFSEDGDDDTDATTTPKNSFKFIIPKLGSITVTFQSLNITGVNTITDMNIGLPSGNHEINSYLKSKEGLDVSTQIFLVIDPVEGEMVQGGSLNESFVLDWNVSDMIIGGTMDILYWREVFEGLELGDLVSAIFGGGSLPSVVTGLGDSGSKKHRWGCLLSGLVSTMVSDLVLDLHINSIRLIHTLSKYSDNNNPVPRDVDEVNMKAREENEERNDHLEEDIDELINNCFQLFLTEYDTLVSRSLFALVRGPSSDLINKHLKKFFERHHPAQKDDECNYQVAKSSSLPHLENDDDDDEGSHHLYRFNESSILHSVNKFIRNSVVEVNTFTSCVASYLQSGAIKEQNLRWQFFNGAEILLQKFRIDNFGRFDVIGAFQPYYRANDTSKLAYVPGRYHLGTKLESGTCQQYNSTTNSSCDKLRSNFTLEISVPDAEIDAIVDVSCTVGQVDSEVGAMILYNTEEFYSLKFHEVLDRPWSFAKPLAGGNFYGFMSSIDSISLYLDLKYFQGGNEGEMLYSSNKTNQLGYDVTSGLTTSLLLLQDIMNGLSRMISGQLQSIDDGTGDGGEGLADAAATSSISDNPGVGNLCAKMLIIFLIANAIILCISMISNRRVSATESDVRSSPPKMPSSLMFHRRISNMERIAIPLVASATVLLFIVANMSTGASVDIAFTATNSTESLSIPSIFTFSLGKTVSEMYHAKVYTLMMLVLVFSGIWPYVKMLLLLLSFVAPQLYLPLQKRERVLIWLDALGKYSLVDSFVLVLMLVSFRFHIEIAGLGTIDSYVIPEFGFYSFMFATIMSLTFGHGVTFLHRKSMLPKRNAVSTGVRESISSHCYSLKHGNRERIKLSMAFNFIWLVITLSSITLMVVGVKAKCFVFDFRGLAGLALGEDSITKHSLISLGYSIPTSVKNPAAIGVQCIRWTYFFFALIMPFTCIGVVAFLYFVPLTLRTQRVVFTLAEICNAWSAIEVFLISVFASLLELSQFAAFMVGTHCDALKGFLGQDTCFDVQSSLGPGSRSLFVGVILHCVIIFYSLRLCHHALEERMIREGDLAPEDCDQSSCSILSLISRFRLGKHLFRECEDHNEAYDEIDDTS